MVTFPGSANPKEFSQQCTPATHTEAVRCQGVLHPCLWPLKAPGSTLGEGGQTSHQPADGSTPELRMSEVMVTSEAIRHAKFQLDCHQQQTNIQLFYRPDALLVAQPTVSEHWREILIHTKYSIFNINSLQNDKNFAAYPLHVRKRTSR